MHQLEVEQQGERRGEGGGAPLLKIGAAVVVLVLLGVGGFFIFSSDDAKPTTAPSGPAPPAAIAPDGTIAALMNAIARDSLADVKANVGKGADEAAKTKLVNTEASAETKVQPLHEAAEKASAEIVKYLVEQKALVTAIDKSHNTPLHYAAKRTATAAATGSAVVKALLAGSEDKDAYMAMENSDKLPALIVAAGIHSAADDNGATAELLTATAPMKAAEEGVINVLHAAAFAGLPVDKFVTAAGADKNALITATATKLGTMETVLPIHAALLTEKMDAEVVGKNLDQLQCGICTQQMKDGRTIVHLAVGVKVEATRKSLLTTVLALVVGDSVGAVLKKQTAGAEPKTALYMAAVAADSESIKAILAKDTDDFLGLLSVTNMATEYTALMGAATSKASDALAGAACGTILQFVQDTDSAEVATVKAAKSKDGKTAIELTTEAATEVQKALKKDYKPVVVVV